MPVECAAPARERRLAPRMPAGGRVRLWPEIPAAAPVEAELVDISDGGFRARHTARSLTSGQTVRFELGAAAGRARVVWTHLAGSAVESGFCFLLSKSSACPNTRNGSCV